MVVSAVVNTRNEEKNITRCLKSIEPFVDEIIVVDMHSTDATIALARPFTQHIFEHEFVGYVEPARNFAIEKASGDWIFILDADEILPESLGLKIRRLVELSDYAYYRFPRKNIIFGKWIRHSGWWPDYQIRLFRKGVVTWGNDIHSIPLTEGRGMDLRAEEVNALHHEHYQTIEQYLDRLNRYTTVETKQKIREGYEFKWQHLLLKPGSEFLTRYFVWEGYKDGLHGLVLSLLQAFSFLVVEIKIWEDTGFTEHQVSLESVRKIYMKLVKDLHYWHFTKLSERETGFVEKLHKIRAKLRL